MFNFNSKSFLAGFAISLISASIIILGAFIYEDSYIFTDTGFDCSYYSWNINDDCSPIQFVLEHHYIVWFLFYGIFTFSLFMRKKEMNKNKFIVGSLLGFIIIVIIYGWLYSLHHCMLICI